MFARVNHDRVTGCLPAVGVSVRNVPFDSIDDLEFAKPCIELRSSQFVGLCEARGMLDVNVDNEIATRRQKPRDLTNHDSWSTDVVKTVAGHDHVYAAADQRDSFGRKRQIDGFAIEQQALSRIGLCKRVDADRKPGRTGVGKANASGADVDDHLALEKRRITYTCLVENAYDLCTSLLPTPTLVVVGDDIVSAQGQGPLAP